MIGLTLEYIPPSEYALVRNVKLVHNIEIRLVTKINGIAVLTHSAILHTANKKREIIFLHLDQNADQTKKLINWSLACIYSRKFHEHSSTTSCVILVTYKQPM